jgi:hypothetical protein
MRSHDDPENHHRPKGAAATYFNLPAEQTVELGLSIEL